MSHAPQAPAETRNEALALIRSTRIRRGVEILRTLATEFPEDAEVARLLAWALTHDDRATTTDIDWAHGALNAALSAHALPGSLGGFAPDVTGRPVRLGIVSSGFRAHPVASFIAPLLEGADPARLQILGYRLGDGSDEVTARMFRHAAGWRELHGLDDAAAAHQITLDRVDVLVLLGGYGPDARPGIAARRPAPVQIAAMAHGSNLCPFGIDARLTDRFIDPASDDTLCMTGAHLCYAPPDNAPEPENETRSHLRNTPARFGAFVGGERLGPATLRLWARVLEAVPDATLTIKSAPLAHARIRADLTSALATLGVSPGRVRLLPPAATVQGHMALHREIDIALDTLPTCGASSTCDALWMGVPVVSLTGHTPATRIGASLLRAAGLDELATDSADAFVDKARELASRVGSVRTGRVDLHRKVASSPLCDAASYGSRFADAVEGYLAERSVPPRTHRAAA